MSRYARARAPHLPPEILDRLEPGLHADGHGLYLRVDETGTRRWTFIYYMHGRRREMGLGGYRRVGLGTAREGAERARQAILAGLDPLANRISCTPPKSRFTSSPKARDAIMNLDLNEPIFTHKEAAEATSADYKTIDNYILHKHVLPHRLEGRRLFSGLQLIQIDLIARLASIFKIPPATGALLATQFLRDPIFARDASAIGDETWARRAAYRVQATIKRHPDGAVEVLLGEGDPDGITVIVPIQMFARLVFVAAAKIKAPS